MPECEHFYLHGFTNVREATPWLEWNHYIKVECVNPACRAWIYTEKFDALERERYQETYAQPRRQSSEVGSYLERYS
jgi:hypothetical protein